jgi:hypothetical protein
MHVKRTSAVLKRKIRLKLKISSVTRMLPGIFVIAKVSTLINTALTGNFHKKKKS